MPAANMPCRPCHAMPCQLPTAMPTANACQLREFAIIAGSITFQSLGPQMRNCCVLTPVYEHSECVDY